MSKKVRTELHSTLNLELCTSGTMKVLRSTEEELTEDKNSKNIPHLENIKVVLVHYNIVNNRYLNDLWVLSTLVPNKSFG